MFGVVYPMMFYSNDIVKYVPTIRNEFALRISGEHYGEEGVV